MYVELQVVGKAVTPSNCKIARMGHRGVGLGGKVRLFERNIKYVSKFDIISPIGIDVNVSFPDIPSS